MRCVCRHLPGPGLPHPAGGGGLPGRGRAGDRAAAARQEAQDGADTGAVHLPLPGAVQCTAVQYSAVQYSAVQCSTVKYNALQCSTVQYNAV